MRQRVWGAMLAVLAVIALSGLVGCTAGTGPTPATPAAAQNPGPAATVGRVAEKVGAEPPAAPPSAVVEWFFAAYRTGRVTDAAPALGPELGQRLRFGSAMRATVGIDPDQIKAVRVTEAPGAAQGESVVQVVVEAQAGEVLLAVRLRETAGVWRIVAIETTG